jgi:hypothetical protein
MKINAILQGSPSEAASTTAAPTAATTAAPSAKIGIAAADTEEDPVSEYEDY